MAEVSAQIIDLILKSHKVLIIPSCPPDGDSIGSSLALFEVLKKLGKTVSVVCADPVPGTLQFLPNSKDILGELKGSNDFIVTLDCSDAEVDKLKYEIVDNKVNIIITPKGGAFSERNVSFKTAGPDFDLVITVDTADVKQLGKIYESNTEFFYRVPVINIDHHISNLNFGKVNYVDSAASSTTEILYGIFLKLEAQTQKSLIDSVIATHLLTGIITDTGSFQNANTTPKSLEVSAELVERGAAQQDIIKHVFRTKNLSTLRLWGEVLSKIQTDEEHKLVWTTMTRADLLKSNATAEEISGIIDDLLTNAPGAEIVFILKEMIDHVACSLRSTTPAANVSKIAEHFGGGGHVQASGFKVKGRLFDEVEKELLTYIRQYQKDRLNGNTLPQKTVNEAPAPKAESMPKPNQENLAAKVNESLLGIPSAPKVTPVPQVRVPTPAPTPAPQPRPQMHMPSAQPMQGQSGMNGERRRRRKKKRSQFGQTIPQSAPQAPSKPPVQEQPRPVQPAQVAQPVAPQPMPKPEPATPAPQPAVVPTASAAPEQPAPTEPPKKYFDPFNPPPPEDSDILAALSKL